jgi:hypothetical protein
MTFRIHKEKVFYRKMTKEDELQSSSFVFYAPFETDDSTQ